MGFENTKKKRHDNNYDNDGLDHVHPSPFVKFSYPSFVPV